MSTFRSLIPFVFVLSFLLPGCGETTKRDAIAADATVSADNGSSTGVAGDAQVEDAQVADIAAEEDTTKIDPCDGVDCGSGGTCENGVCECSPGYEFNSDKMCQDINECAQDNGGCGDVMYNTCTNNPGAAPTCTDVDECEVNNGNCGENTTCTNNKNAAPTCTCNKGFVYNPEGACVTTPACAFVNCGQHSTCDNGTCVCDVGYEADAEKVCQDIDECQTDNGGCGDAKYNTCTNNAGAAPTCSDIDECATDNGGCGENAVCTNNKNSDPGCTCKKGYLYNPDGVCVVTLACQFVTCAANSHCEQGGCVCDTGYEADAEKVCQDIDECQTDNGGCGDAKYNTCTNNAGAAPTCSDIDECATDNGGCGENTVCTNNKNSGPGCTCKKGYLYNPDGACVATPECTFKTCGANSYCNGGECLCNSGYEGDGNTGCTDIDECETDNGGCGDAKYTICVNNPGSKPTCNDIDECETDNGGCGMKAYYSCTNNPAAEPTCADIDECQTDNGGCGDSSQTYCINLLGQPASCIDVDECAAALDACDANAKCVNLKAADGGYDCVCNDGYYKSGIQCLDTDECVVGTHDCSNVATCANTPAGSFTCTCKAGFSGDGKTCTDIDECATGEDMCATNATCTNTFGNYNCACNTGYQGNGYSCTDIDECAAGTDSCSDNAVCSNLAGSKGQFNCVCNDGFVGDGNTCADIDECEIQTDKCSVYATCLNTYGGYKCSCAPGYQGDGFTCVDIDECDTETDQCGAYATCLNTPAGSYSCTCDKAGHSLLADGKTCFDINECLTQNGGCEQLCKNLDNGFLCQCNTGYILADDKTSCVDIDECDNDSVCPGNWTCVNKPGTYSCEPCAECGCMEKTACNYNADATISDGTCIYPESDTKDCFGNDTFTCGGEVEYEGYTYQTAEFGSDCWTLQNSRYLPSINSYSAGSNTTPHYYVVDFNPDNVDGVKLDAAKQAARYIKYGALYNAAAVQAGGICPPGFAVPTYTQLTTLRSLLANTSGKSKSVEKNSTLADLFQVHDNKFCGLVEANQKKDQCSYWSSTKSGSSYGMLSHYYSSTTKKTYWYAGTKWASNGHSVRCVAEANPCANNTHGCDEVANCIKNPGETYQCVCPDGYEGDGKTCTDINECDTDNGGCGTDGKCTNEDGSYSCDCAPGFTFQISSKQCEDDDECVLGTHTCSGGSVCVNLAPGFDCDDVDECADKNTYSCHDDAYCKNTVEGYDCVCNPGFLGNGTVCTDTDECGTGTHNCDANALCANTVGSFSCTCNTGYDGDGTTCEDIDECDLGTHDCGSGYSCVNIPGAFLCKDVDECVLGTDQCDANATCHNEDGGYGCVCDLGFSGDGQTCKFGSDGSNGAFEPTQDTVLPAGLYQFTSVNIPKGVTVTTNGTAVLDIRAKGSVIIDGTINLSGGHGGIGQTKNYWTDQSSAKNGIGGGGGATGNPLLNGTSNELCPGQAGGGSGAEAATAWGSCDAKGGKYGGGGSGRAQSAGAGGGGYAGGGGGGSRLYNGSAGAAFPETNQGGQAGSQGPADLNKFGLPTPGQGGVAPGAYAGHNGASPSVGQCNFAIYECAPDDTTITPIYGPVESYQCTGDGGAFWSYDGTTAIPGCWNNGPGASGCFVAESASYTAEQEACLKMKGQQCLCMKYTGTTETPASDDYEWVKKLSCQSPGFWSMDGTNPIPGCVSNGLDSYCLSPNESGYTQEQKDCASGASNCECVRWTEKTPESWVQEPRYDCQNVYGNKGFWSTDGQSPIEGCISNKEQSGCLDKSAGGYTQAQSDCNTGKADCQCLKWTKDWVPEVLGWTKICQCALPGFWSYDGETPIDGCESNYQQPSDFQSCTDIPGSPNSSQGTAEQKDCLSCGACQCKRWKKVIVGNKWNGQWNLQFGVHTTGWIQTVTPGYWDYTLVAGTIDVTLANVLVPAEESKIVPGAVSTVWYKMAVTTDSDGNKVLTDDGELVSGVIKKTYKAEIVDYETKRNCEPVPQSIQRPGAAGGGGSIGAQAASDLSVEKTFYPGSGGGAGAAGDDLSKYCSGGGGGGGGGGALRVTSETSITVTGSLLANGGNGGYAKGNGAGGGAGSGGVIWIEAPTVNVSGTVSARGGYAGTDCAPAEAAPENDGLVSNAKGGLGRIRVTTTADQCSLDGNFNPPLSNGCSPAETAEKAYVSTY